ncbi:MAG: hypothetical protein ABL958_07350 [Bdellovibrionia bacterium]
MSEVNKDEALKQIAEIAGVLKASNTLMFPGRGIMALGLGVLLVPLIALPTKWLTFGMDYGPNKMIIIAILHVVFYFFYFNGIRWAVRHIWKENPMEKAHPVVANSLAIEKPIIVSIAGVILIFAPIGQAHLAYPMVYILLGILFNLYGRLSKPLVLWISWSYILFGLVFAALSVYQNDDMWLPFNTYLGATLFIMGYNAWKDAKK